VPFDPRWWEHVRREETTGTRRPALVSRAGTLRWSLWVEASGWCGTNNHRKQWFDALSGEVVER
jgi:hypothetical protein